MQMTSAELKELFDALARRMSDERDALCALDGAIGDGDHGIAMEQGMQAAAAAARAKEGNLQEVVQAAASAFLNAVGASSGPLYATGLLRAAKALGPVDSVTGQDLLRIIPAIAEGIAHRGKAEPGQKTMFDAWSPAAAAVSAGESGAAIVAAAKAGAEATKAMEAGLGRASRLGERALGHPDPGAVSAAMLIEEIVRASGV